MTEPDAISPAEERKLLVKGIRHMAFLLEAHPELPSPKHFWSYGKPEFEIELKSFKTEEEETTVKAQLQDIVRALRKSYFKGKIIKDYSGANFTLTVPLSPAVNLVVKANREEVCTRRVVGSRTELQPVYETINTGMKPVVVEDVEWDCEPILAGATA